MARYFFIFGYESPQDWKTNDRFKSDAESSQAIWIVAPNKETAMRAGRAYAEMWVGGLFVAQPLKGFAGWTNANYAHWIEDNPEGKFPNFAPEDYDEINAE